MDRSLDEIIAERPQRQNRGGRGRGRRGNNHPRDGVKKSYREDRVDLDRDWVHDKFEDDRDTRPARGPRPRRGDRYSPEPDHAPTGAKIRVENLHYDLTEEDLEDLFTRIGPVSDLSLRYDRAGRSEGVAFVTYNRLSDARTAIREFDGANAKGQPIRLTLLPAGGGSRRNPFDSVERPKGSLFDRVERPRDRDNRSLSPESEGADGGSRRRRRGGGGGRVRRSDVSKPPPDHIDRYVPGQRSPERRNGSGRRPGQRREERNDSSNRRTANGRPRKTQEELDQEMEDYWGTANAGAGTADKEAIPEEVPQVAPASTAAAGDDDIDMIE